MTNIIIVNQIIALLGSEYKVINTYNNTQPVNVDGVIAVTISNYESLNHGNSKDCKLTVSVSGQTLTDQDLTQARINQMWDYVLQSLDVDLIRSNLENCAGVIINSGAIQSDGESNNFTIAIQLFLCID